MQTMRRGCCVDSLRPARTAVLPPVGSNSAAAASFSTAAAASSVSHAAPHAQTGSHALPQGWVRCFVGIGCNIGHRARNLQLALVHLQSQHADLSLHATSFLYESTPVGSPPEHQSQPRFLNAVLELHTNLQPLQLLDRLKEVEQKMGRDTNMVRNGPRIIDLDILRQCTASRRLLARQIHLTATHIAFACCLQCTTRLRFASSTIGWWCLIRAGPRADLCYNR